MRLDLPVLKDPRARYKQIENPPTEPMTIYSSQFDEKTGALVRVVEVPPPRRNGYNDEAPWKGPASFREKYGRRIHGGGDAFSPVPETVDVSITDRCGFGCLYCYQDSRPRRKHAPIDLVEKIITGFSTPPYQIAIGGGEPTENPDLPYILEKARMLGTVPNYTTNGANLTQAVVTATNAYCGGVAVTYHRFKGIEWFLDHYVALRKQLTCQVNVHVIADKDVALSLHELVNRLPEFGKLRVVLLAYYPDVGRAKMDRILTKHVYARDLPIALKKAMDAGLDIAFSEGLLPYVFSRPELGIDTRFFMRSEGRFSCYVDPRGRMSESSFRPPDDRSPTVWEKSSQELWDSTMESRAPFYDSCDGCKFSDQCAAPHEFHYLSCAFASNNATAATPSNRRDDVEAENNEEASNV